MSPPTPATSSASATSPPTTAATASRFGALVALMVMLVLPAAGGAAAPPTALRERRSPAGTFRSVSAGDAHSGGLQTDATLTCWGWNGDGQAARSPAGASTARGRRRPPPTRSPGTRSAQASHIAAAGDFHTCGLKTDGTLACWGNDPDGQTDAPGGTFTAGCLHQSGTHCTCSGQDTWNATVGA